MATLTLRVTRGGSPAVGSVVILGYARENDTAGTFVGTTNAQGEIVKTAPAAFEAVAFGMVRHTDGSRVGASGIIFVADQVTAWNT